PPLPPLIKQDEFLLSFCRCYGSHFGHGDNKLITEKGAKELKELILQYYFIPLYMKLLQESRFVPLFGDLMGTRSYATKCLLSVLGSSFKDSIHSHELLKNYSSESLIATAGWELIPEFKESFHEGYVPTFILNIVTTSYWIRAA